MEQNTTNEDDFLPQILQKYKGKNPFLVPEDYFQHLSDQLIAEANVAALVQNSTEQSVPQNYFESFYDNLNTTILIDDIKSSAKEEDFKVPENYFDSLTDRILNQVKPEEIKIQKEVIVRKFNFKAWAYAAAACTILAVSVVVFQNSKKEKVETTFALDSLSDEELETYVYENIQSFDDETIEILSSEAGFFDHISEFESMSEDEADELIKLYQ